MFSNDVLIADLKEAASELSYFNAAEGDSWRKERESRQLALARFNEIKDHCIIAGIDVKPILQGYLV